MLHKFKSLRIAAEDAVKSQLKAFRTPAPPTTEPKQGNLDSPHLDARDDVLHRYRIAREIYRIISNQAPDQSVRIGLFGDWGYGKTTIAHWVAEMADRDAQIVVWFNPWSVRDLSDLWLSFLLKLRSVLRRHKVTLPGGLEAKATLAEFKRELGTVANSIGDGKLASAAAGLLKFSTADIEALKRRLRGRKVVVIIDDIDRAIPTLLPQLFLSLRELLDLPGFAFLVPFEKSTVANALLEQHGAWGSGERFLEKILDFQITIPQSTADARWELFSKSVAEFVFPQALVELKDLCELLPDNPRRIKRIARMFELVSHETKRHKVDELDWMSLLMGFMIKLESEEFFQRFVEAFRDAGARLTESYIRDEAQRTEAAEKRITDVIAKVDIKDVELKERLKALAQRWEKERSYWHDARVTYTLRIFDLPDAFTWAEIDHLIATWNDPLQTAYLEQLIGEKAKGLGQSSDAVVRELIVSLVGKYHQCLEAAANVFLVGDHSREAASAAALIAQIEALLCSSVSTSDSRVLGFEKLLGTYGTWAHFTTNKADAELRDVEQRLLRKLLDAAGANWQAYAAKLKANDGPFEKREFNDFVQAATTVFAGRARELALVSFREKDGVYKLLKRELPEMSQVLLLDAESALWSGNQSDAPMQRVLKDAARAPEVQRNAHRFLDMATGRHQISFAISTEELQAFLRHERPAVALWDAAIAQPIQFRMLDATRKIRGLLRHLGVAEELLAFPDWLHAGEERENGNSQA